MLLPLPVRPFSAFLLSKFPLVPKNHFLPWADLPPAPPHSLLPQSISQSEASVHPLLSCQDLTTVPQSARFAGRTTGRRADSEWSPQASAEPVHSGLQTDKGSASGSSPPQGPSLLFLPEGSSMSEIGWRLPNLQVTAQMSPHHAHLLTTITPICLISS